MLHLPLRSTAPKGREGLIRIEGIDNLCCVYPGRPQEPPEWALHFDQTGGLGQRDGEPSSTRRR
jgi:hypothetical protein